LSDWSTPLVGIYCLVFPSGHFYYGQSKHLAYRNANHLSKLRKELHANRWMLAVCRKHGLPTMRIECLCAEEDLDAAEQMYLDEYHGKPFCLNIARHAGAPARGRKATTDEVEAKRLQGKQSWANGTNALIHCIGMNSAILNRPDVRAKIKAIKSTPESRKRDAEIRTALHQDPEFKAKHAAGIARHFANTDQQQSRLSALRIKHQDPEFKARRIAASQDACRKQVECVETGQVWSSAAEWKRWIKEEYGVIASLHHIRHETPYKGFTFKYLA